ncbi:MAG: indolepyruvate ferredoxin oxidoreductase, partial [Azoarcus sp.]|nr:indolepyruvate ferredoxin oxidoreductase [Azoarcus sp.]
TAGGFVKNPARWVMVPANAQKRVPEVFAREKALREESEASAFNRLEPGTDKRVGFVTSGPAYMHVREAFPDAPVLKLGLSHPVPMDKVRALAGEVDTLVVVEETEQLMETEIRAAGIATRGKDILPAAGELPPYILKKSLAALFPELQNAAPSPVSAAALPVFPRPPTMCVACPHLGVYYTLSQLKNVTIAGDIGCYTLGAGHPWNALDTTICMGASMGMALGMDKGRGPADEKKNIVAVIGDSTFMHMGMQGLLDIAYNRGNVTVLLLDNRTVGMTGGQDNPASGRDIHGDEAPRVDFAKVVESLGIDPAHIRVVDPYILPVLFKTLREEVKHNGPSVIITNRPCVLIDDYEKQAAYEVNEPACTGCGNCIDIGCPAIHVTRREKVVKPSGKEVELAFVNIETAACTGCKLCLQPCAPNAIRPTVPTFPVSML